MEVRFYGVRGSVAVSGPGYQATGGATTCVEVAAQGCRLLFDGGTGLRAAGENSSEEPIHLLFTHCHWDHIQGVPFFGPAWRKGQAIQYNSDVCVVLEVTHRTPGNLRAFVQAILRSIRTGKSMDVRFSSAEKIETVPLMTYKMEFSYKSGDDYVFVNPENYEEVTVTPEFVGDAKNFLTENSLVTMTFVEEKAVILELPSSVILTVANAPEGLKGDSANNVQKTVTLETGVEINAPLFIKTGEKIKVDTRTGKYMERA